MNVPLVDLKAQYRSIKPEVDGAIQRVLDHTGFILGEEVRTFEAAFAAYLGASAAVGVASGTAALQLALQACGVGRGDEVITTAHTFIATAEPISNLGAIPVFVDIDPATFNMDPSCVEAAITPRTRAIVPVHLYGRPAPMDEIMQIAARHGLMVIEDAAQAHGARYRGRACGTIGALGCFSFYPGKNLGAYGDGGAITSEDPELIARVRKLRDHGRISKYEHDEIGSGERLDALQAAILGVKLSRLAEWTASRRGHAHRYSELLAGTDLVTPTEDPDDEHVFHLYVVRSERRDALLEHLVNSGIGAGVHYPVPLHRQKAYRGLPEVRLPATELAASQVLSLPMFPELTDEQIESVVDVIGRFDR
jgi:dTDP-4-amino-4,6-dideoxygalactose transaminase